MTYAWWSPVFQARQLKSTEFPKLVSETAGIWTMCLSAPTLSALNPALSSPCLNHLWIPKVPSAAIISFLCRPLSHEIRPCLSAWKTPTYPTNVNSNLSFPHSLGPDQGAPAPVYSLNIVLLSWSRLSVCPLDCELLKSNSSPEPNTMPNAWWCLDRRLQTEWMNVWRIKVYVLKEGRL